jgi:hypothetical protein
MVISGYTQKLKRDDMALFRRPESLEAIKKAFESRGADMKLRSYHLPEYQQVLIDILAKESGLSKAGVVRQIIDEWYEYTMEERE